MSTTLHAIFNVVFDNIYFVIGFVTVHGWKKRCSESSQKSISEKSIFGHFEVIDLNVQSFPNLGVLISC